MSFKNKTDQRGISTLILVLIVGAAALLAAREAAVLVQNSADMTNITMAKNESAAYADACLDTLLRRWMIADEYAVGTYIVVMEDGECAVSSRLESDHLYFNYSGQSRDSSQAWHGEAVKENGRIEILNLARGQL